MDPNATNSTIIAQTVEQDIHFRLKKFLTEPHQVLAVLLSVTAILLNVFSLLAISKVQHRMTTHFLFIVSLALSDITIGVSVLMYAVNKVINQSYMPGRGPWEDRLISRCMFVFIKSLNSTSLNISLLNLIGMATDHFIAIMKPLHYQTLMTKRRASVIIAALWMLATLCGCSDYLSAIKLWPMFSKYYNYCEVMWLTPYQDEYVTFVLALSCAACMTVMYGLIYRKVRNRGRSTHARQITARKRHKKALVTTLFIVGSFTICWLPMCLFQLTLVVIVHVSPDLLRSISGSLKYADQFLFDLLLLNCIVDPIIYAVRIKEIRLGYRRLCCFLCMKHQVVRQDSRNFIGQASSENRHITTSLIRRHSVKSSHHNSLLIQRHLQNTSVCTPA